MTKRRLRWTIAAAVVTFGAAAALIQTSDLGHPPATFWVCNGSETIHAEPGSERVRGWTFDTVPDRWSPIPVVRTAPSVVARILDLIGARDRPDVTFEIARHGEFMTAPGAWQHWVRIEFCGAFEDDFRPDPALAGRWHQRTSSLDEGIRVTLAADGTMSVDAPTWWRDSSVPLTGRWGTRDGVLVLIWPSVFRRRVDFGVLRPGLRRADAPVPGEWSVTRIE